MNDRQLKCYSGMEKHGTSQGVVEHTKYSVKAKLGRCGARRAGQRVYVLWYGMHG